MKVLINQGLSVVLMAMLGFSFSACTGVTETPDSSKNQSQSEETASVENHVIQKVPSKYMPLLAKAEKGNAQAQYDIAVLFNEGKKVQKDHKEAFQWFKKAADNGYAESQLVTGMYYSGGGGGVCKADQQEAFNYYKKAADNGNAEAQNFTAFYYYSGVQDGMARDEVKAFKYAKKGALQGNAKAQQLLGVLYMQGLPGVPKNEVIGYAWVDQAVKQGNPDAINTKSSMLACPIFRKNSLAQGEALSAALEQKIPKEKKS